MAKKTYRQRAQEVTREQREVIPGKLYKNTRATDEIAAILPKIDRAKSINRDLQRRRQNRG